MRKWYVEAIVGIVPVIIIFLAFIGLNVIPIILMLVLIAALFVMNKLRGGIAVGALQGRKRKEKAIAPLTFDQIGGPNSALDL
jgi:cell division protease FtsH